jgi:hypothetical protein
MERRRKRIIGDQMKGRGIFLDIEAKRLTEADPEWTEAQRGKPFKGEKFYMFDFEDTQADALGGPEKKRVRRREFWPVDRPIPAKYKSGRWIEKGIWEVRGDKKGQGYTIWRDYSPEERTRMGEILDARYTLGKTYMLMANDLATGRFFKDVAENEAWASTMEPAGSWKEASAYRRFWNDPEIGWVRVPEDSIKDTGGKKKWGALAGKWVRAEIWKDLNELDIQNRPSSWRRLLTTWKINMTARNPVVHMNNIMSNLMFMEWRPASTRISARTRITAMRRRMAPSAPTCCPRKSATKSSSRSSTRSATRNRRGSIRGSPRPGLPASSPRCSAPASRAPTAR